MRVASSGAKMSSNLPVFVCQVWTWSEVIHTALWLAGRAYHTTCCVSPSLCVIMGGWVEGCPDGDGYVVDIERGAVYQVS